VPTTTVKAGVSFAYRLQDIWNYRETLLFLAFRDIKIRYSQTILGIAWILLQPLLLSGVFVIVFGYLVALPSGNIPYAVLALSGLTPWMFFSRGLGETTQCLVINQSLLTKIYFPRLLIPIASLIVILPDLILNSLLLIVVMVAYGLDPLRLILMLPILAIMSLLSGLSIGIWLSALNVRYRDVGYTIPFLTQILIFVSPVSYSAALVPKQWQMLYFLNPAAGPIELFRWCVGAPAIEWSSFVVWIVMTFAMLILGTMYFHRAEPTFADIV